MRAVIQLLVFFSLLSTWAFSQEKIQWNFDYVAFPSALQISAKIENGWHLYALDLDPSIGPVPTQIVLEKKKIVKEKNKLRNWKIFARKSKKDFIML